MRAPKHLAGVLLLTALTTLAACGVSTSAPSVVETTEDAPAATAEASPSKTKAPNRLSDNGFKASDIKVKNESGFVTGTIRLTNNTGEDRDFVVVTLTALTKAGKTLGTVNGAVDHIDAGRTVTVQVVGTDAFKTTGAVWELQAS